MRNRRLHDSLRAFALDAARTLSADLEAGAEVEFELDERSTGRSVLYRYRPLIAPFISERWQQLRTLESFADAAEQLGSGSAAYLRVQGLGGDADPEPALLVMLERLWEDATSFVFSAVQMCLSAYVVTYLHGVLGYSLLVAGVAMSAANAGGVVGRVAWGYAALATMRTRASRQLPPRVVSNS